ncbi:hypothetical protein BRADI_2g10942v3 [Brachypodium distachyon]|uniref:AIPP2-like SPOC-like domain-containing protein n=1 Tax=Brachypodium distachyon TaxID=15368 RepID=A0A2K2D7W1_BRADI|nr:hypothetical protein BRADI_2g10942v3 [Brachypodium distachyon]
MQEFYGVSLPDNTRVVVQTRRPVPSSSRLHNVMVSPQSCIDKPRSSSSKPDNVGASPSNNIESRRASSRGSNDRAVSLRKNTELSSRLNKAPTCSHKSIENPRPSSSSLDNGRVPTPRNTKVPRPSFPRPNDGMVSQPKDNERSRPCQHRDGFSSRKSEKLACAGSKDGSNSKSNIPKKLHPSLMVRNSRNAGQMPSVHARKEDQVIQTHRRNLGDNSFPKIGKDLSTHQTVKASSMGNNMELNTKSKRDDKFKRKRTEPLSEEELETLKMRTEPHEDHDSEEALNCKPVKRTRRYICNDDDDEDVDQNLVGVEGGTAPLTTQTIVLKSIEVSNSFVSESFKSRRKRIEPLSEEELETSMMRTEPHEDRDSVEAENRKQVKRTRRYICNDDDDDDDDADQNLVGVQGGTAPLTTQTTVLKSTEVSNSFVSESFKSRRKRIEPLSEEELETLMMRTELHEDRDSVEAENCKPVKRTRRYISNDDDDNDDDADQNLGGIEGGTAPLTTQTTVLKSTEVKNTFVSESFKLQPYSDLPIDEPIWSGVFKIGNKYVPLAAHLSVKHCDKVWKISRSLQPRVEVTKLSRLEAWPKSFEALGPTDDSIALYFLPHEMRLGQSS